MTLKHVFDFNTPLLTRGGRTFRNVATALVDSSDPEHVRKGEWVVVTGETVTRPVAGSMASYVTGQILPVLTGSGRTDVQSALRVSEARHPGAIARTSMVAYNARQLLETVTGAVVTSGDTTAVTTASLIGGKATKSTGTLVLEGVLTWTGRVGYGFQVVVTSATDPTYDGTYFFAYEDATYDDDADTLTITGLDFSGATAASVIDIACAAGVEMVHDTIAATGAFTDAIEIFDTADSVSIRFAAGSAAGNLALNDLLVEAVNLYDDDTVIYPEGTLTADGAENLVVFAVSPNSIKSGDNLHVALMQHPDYPAVLVSVLAPANVMTETADSTTADLVTAASTVSFARVLRGPYRLTGVGSDGEQTVLDVILT